MSTIDFTCDTLIIGSGAAGLSLAVRLAPQQKVIILSKGLISEGATFYAQGGIAAVFDEKDSIASHVEDTLVAGAGIVQKPVAEFVARNARHCIQWLINQGVVFDTYTQKNGVKNYHLTRESGHAHRRILHVADTTGREVEITLANKARAHPNIQILQKISAIDLILSDRIGLSGRRRVIGAWIWNQKNKKVETCQATSVVLATGGASKVYRYTTNPNTASGDGIAIGWRAGCRVANLEFNQFHPTSLFHPKASNFLLTEAFRGEGAYLRRPDGSRFMPDFDARNELAPRDIVARAIDYEMKRLGANCMYLDISHKPATFILQHFPMIYKKLLGLGIDLTKEPIPIVPAAHYTCGGIMVDQHGRTDVSGLYAIGEVSYTGLHGANRMASNSLLECLVYGWSASVDILQRFSCLKRINSLPSLNDSRVNNQKKQNIIKTNWKKLQRLMWDWVGIIRTTRCLERGLHHISIIQQEIAENYKNLQLSNELFELRNMVQVAELIVRSAMMRKESRGVHYTLDYPKKLPISGPSVLSPGDDSKDNNLNSKNYFK